MPYNCKNCKRHFSVKVGAVMEESNLPLQKWIIAIYWMATNIKGISTRLARELDISRKGAWFLSQIIRAGFTQDNLEKLKV